MCAFHAALCRFDFRLKGGGLEQVFRCLFCLPQRASVWETSGAGRRYSGVSSGKNWFCMRVSSLNLRRFLLYGRGANGSRFIRLTRGGKISRPRYRRRRNKPSPARRAQRRVLSWVRRVGGTWGNRSAVRPLHRNRVVRAVPEAVLRDGFHKVRRVAGHVQHAMIGRDFQARFM